MTHAGFFEGVGGFTLGAERAGIKTTYTCEIDDFRHSWLEYYLPNARHERNIENAEGIKADIYTAGFPCQDISRANPKAKGLHGERSGLFFPFMDIVRRNKPRFVILENSPMLVSRRDLLHILREFTECGYDAEWQIISKRAFGYPDERKRLILIAYDSKIRRFQTQELYEQSNYEACRKKIIEGKQFLPLPDRNDTRENWFEFISRVCKDSTGVSRELAAKHIAAYGDAVCPDVAQLAFELIKLFEKK